MLRNWLVYLLGLAGALVFHIYYFGWYSWFVLVLAVALPWFSLLVSLLAACAPAASNVTQIAQVYGHEGDYASAINVLTSLLCIVTMPLMVLLYQL